jgi:hypothetical protein
MTRYRFRAARGPKGRKTVKTGYAKLTATTQHFLNTCPAVKSWTASDDEETATFIYDEMIEVPIVPEGVDFADDDVSDTMVGGQA